MADKPEEKREPKHVYGTAVGKATGAAFARPKEDKPKD